MFIWYETSESIGGEVATVDWIFISKRWFRMWRKSSSVTQIFVAARMKVMWNRISVNYQTGNQNIALISLWWRRYGKVWKTLKVPERKWKHFRWKIRFMSFRMFTENRSQLAAEIHSHVCQIIYVFLEWFSRNKFRNLVTWRWSVNSIKMRLMHSSGGKSSENLIWKRWLRESKIFFY